MIASALKGILTLFMPVILFFNTLSFDMTYIFEDCFEASAVYTFTNSIPGSADGTVTLYSRLNGNYELYWGDSNGEKLSADVDGYSVLYSEFANITVTDGEGFCNILPFTYIPENAETVLVYKDSFLCTVTDIPDEKQSEYTAPLYSFGVLSDIHYGRYYTLFADVAEITFPNALNFFELLGVSAVAVSGDISNSGEEESFKNYCETVSDYDFPVFTVTGNHDVGSDFTLENWNRYINNGVYGECTAEGVIAVAENNLDFAYSVPGTDEIFIFFNQIAWEYGNPETDRIVTDSQLDWLENQLKEYENKTVFLFFHTFTSDINGNPGTGCGNLVNPKGTTYDLVYTPGAADEVRFRALLSEYTNVIYFSGHSHFAYDMQKYNPDLNITNYNGLAATSVHVSSVTAPRRVTDRSTEIESYNMSSSEGYYVEVYSDCIILRGVEFFDGQFLSYALYRIG